MPELYTHTTTLDSLHKILNSGKIKSVRHMANEDPTALMNVEETLGMRARLNMEAKDALQKLKDAGKNPDKIFLTRNGANKNYGDVIIAKQLQHPKEHFRFNFVPNEYVTRRPLSVKHNAIVYVPKKHLSDLVEKYKGINFKSEDEFTHKITLNDRFRTIARKILNKTAEDLHGLSNNKLHKLLHTNKATYTGSSALGTNVGTSDTDIFIPYKRQSVFNNKVKALKELYPHLQETKHSLTKPDKVTLSGTHNGKQVDLVVGYGDKATNYINKFKEIKNTLSKEDIDTIKTNKARLKDAWILPNYRYKRYKKQLDKKFGLKEFYF